MSWATPLLSKLFPVRAASAMPETTKRSVPSGVPRTPDVLDEPVPIQKEFAPKEILRYRQLARRGDGTNLYWLYDEMPRGGAGPQISRSREAIEAAECEFLPMPLAARDDTVRTPEATMGREVAAYIDEQLRPHIPVALTIRARREHYGIGAGAFVVEAGTGPEGRERAISLEEIPPRRFRMDPRSFKYLFRAKPGGSFESTEQRLAEGGLLFFEQGPGSVTLDQKGLLWQIIIPWGVYQFGFRWWANLCEVYGKPWRLASVAKNVENGDQVAEDLIRKMGASGWAVKPDGVDVQFISEMTQAQSDVHERLEEFCLRAFDAGLLGHSQATGARENAGAKTSDRVAEDVGERRTAQQLRNAAADLQEQWVRRMVIRNYGDKVGAKHTPVLSLRPSERLDREAEGRIAVLAVNAGAELPEAEFLKRIGYRQVRPGERAMSRATSGGVLPPGKDGQKLGEFLAHVGLASAPPPVLGADGAPAGVAEDLLAPYRDIFTAALKDGAKPFEALTRVVRRAKDRPEAKVLVDRLSSVLVASTGHGIEDAREERGAK